MNILRDLKLWRATADTLANMLQALATAPPYTLMWLSIKYTPFNPQVMQALCALLGHSKLVAELVLHNCGLTDDLACLLSTALGKLPELRIVNLSWQHYWRWRSSSHCWSSEYATWTKNSGLAIQYDRKKRMCGVWGMWENKWTSEALFLIDCCV